MFTSLKWAKLFYTSFHNLLAIKLFIALLLLHLKNSIGFSIMDSDIYNKVIWGEFCIRVNSCSLKLNTNCKSLVKGSKLKKYFGKNRHFRTFRNIKIWLKVWESKFVHTKKGIYRLKYKLFAFILKAIKDDRWVSIPYFFLSTSEFGSSLKSLEE